MRRQRALAAVLAVLLLSALAVPVGLLLQQQAQSEAMLLELTQARLSAVDRVTASAVSNELRLLADAVQAQAERPLAVRAFGPAGPGQRRAQQELLADLRRANSGLAGAYAVAPGGQLLLSSPLQPNLEGRNFAYRDWFQGALLHPGAYISEGFRAQVLDRPLALGVAAAVRDPSGEVVGVLSGIYRLDRLQRLVDVQSGRSGMAVTVVDHHGLVLARTGGLPAAPEPTRDARVLERLGTLDTGRSGRTGGEDGRLWAVAGIGATGGAVLVEIPTRVGLGGVPEQHRRTRHALLALTGLLLAAGALGALLETRRRRSVRTLCEREAYLDSVLQTMDAGVASCDARGRLVYFNRHNEQLLGRDVEPDADPEQWASLYHLQRPDGTPLAAREMPLLRALWGGAPVRGADHVVSLPGQAPRALRVNARLVRDRNGRVLGAVAVSHDITELLEHQAELADAQAALREAHEELERQHAFADALLESVDTGLTAMDSEGNAVLRNAAARRMFARDVTRSTSTRLRAPEERFALRALRGRPSDRQLLTLDNGSHAPTELQVTARQIRAADGTLLGAFAAFSDVTEQRRLLRRVQEHADQFRSAAQLVGLGRYEVDGATRRATYSEEVLALCGAPLDDPRRTNGRLFRDDVIAPEDREEYGALLAHVLDSGNRAEGVFRMYRLDNGEQRWVRIVLAPSASVPGRATGTMIDVTALAEARLEAEAAGALHQAVLTASPDAIVVTEVATGRVTWASPGVRTILGLAPEQLLEAGPEALLRNLHEEDHERLAQDEAGTAGLPDGGVSQLRFRSRHSDGGWRWLSRRATPFQRDAEGAVTHVLAVLRDVSDVQAAQERLAHAALHDPLTGLPNRTLLLDRLGTALERTRRSAREVAVLLIDLDGFKRVNDTAGHAAGDAVLAEVAARLLGAVRTEDTVARLGGDEFAVLLEPVGEEGDDQGAALRVAQRVRDAVGVPIVVRGTQHVVTASTGVAFAGTLAGGPAPRAEEVLQDADAAMYRAKHHGKDRVEVFASSLRAELTERSRVEAVLRSAVGDRLSPYPLPRLDSGRAVLSVAYQPVFDASGALHGFEALARLQDEHGLSIPPSAFVAVAEDTGLVRSLGTIVLDEALARLGRWRAEAPGRDGLAMSVNLSALQVEDGHLVDGVLTALQRHGLAPADLQLEVTESVLLDAAPGRVSALRHLHELGVRIAVDDFGTGYASLRYLTELPVDVVKVDRSFTAGLTTDPTSATIVRAVARLAAELGLDCVVEGVETEQQRRVLPHGVLVQGFLLGRPAAGQDIDLDRMMHVRVA